MKPKYDYRVTITYGGEVHQWVVTGTSAGNAVALFVRKLVGKPLEYLKCHPRTDHQTGGWRGVSVECLGVTRKGELPCKAGTTYKFERYKKPVKPVKVERPDRLAA